MDVSQTLYGQHVLFAHVLISAYLFLDLVYKGLSISRHYTGSWRVFDPRMSLTFVALGSFKVVAANMAIAAFFMADGWPAYTALLGAAVLFGIGSYLVSEADDVFHDNEGCPKNIGAALRTEILGAAQAPKKNAKKRGK